MVGVVAARTHGLVRGPTNCRVAERWQRGTASRLAGGRPADHDHERWAGSVWRMGGAWSLPRRSAHGRVGRS